MRTAGTAWCDAERCDAAWCDAEGRPAAADARRAAAWSFPSQRVSVSLTGGRLRQGTHPLTTGFMARRAGPEKGVTGRSRDAEQGNWGPYRRVEILHEGRQARSWLAVGRDGGALLSLKTLQPFADVMEQRAALLREGELQAACAHPAIARVVGWGQADVGVFVAREYVVGFTLAELKERVARGGAPVPDAVIAEMGDGLLAALDRVHGCEASGGAAELVHRDVTPSNVLVGLDGRVRLTDFGLAHGFAWHGVLEDDEIAQGTPRYLPPEVARGVPPDARADLHQLAACLAEVWGAPNASPAALEGAALRELVDARGAAGAVLRKALAPDPQERYRSASEMRDAWREAWCGGAVTDVAAWIARACPDLVEREQARLERARPEQARPERGRPERGRR